MAEQASGPCRNHFLHGEKAYCASATNSTCAAGRKTRPLGPARCRDTLLCRGRDIWQPLPWGHRASDSHPFISTSCSSLCWPPAASSPPSSTSPSTWAQDISAAYVSCQLAALLIWLCRSTRQVLAVLLAFSSRRGGFSHHRSGLSETAHRKLSREPQLNTDNKHGDKVWMC